MPESVVAEKQGPTFKDKLSGFQDVMVSSCSAFIVSSVYIMFFQEETVLSEEKLPVSPNQTPVQWPLFPTDELDSECVCRADETLSVCSCPCVHSFVSFRCCVWRCLRGLCTGWDRSQS